MNWFRSIFKDRKKGNVMINGQTFTGNDISISNGSVYIDGALIGNQGQFQNVPKIEVSIQQSEIYSVQTGSSDISITGSAGKLNTGSGDITVHGNVWADIQTGSGNVSAWDVSGNIKTSSGDIKAKS